MSLVSEMLKIPLDTLKWMEWKYFNPKAKACDSDESDFPLLNAEPTNATKVTVKNMTPDEILFLIHNTTLHNQAILSLQKRCIMFHRQFPNRRIKPRVISKIYKYFGIKKKKVKV